MYRWLKTAELTPTEMSMLGGALGPVGASIGGAYASEPGERLRGGLSAGLGSMGGAAISGYTVAPLLALGGSAAGGLAGALIGKGNREDAILGALIGSGIGSAGGLMLGSALGAGGGYELGMPKKAVYIPASAQRIVKQAFHEAAQLSLAAAPYVMPQPVRSEQASRGLPLPAVAAIGAGLTGLHLAGDAPTFGNRLRRTINQTLGTDLDTQSRASAVFNALR